MNEYGGEFYCKADFGREGKRSENNGMFSELFSAGLRNII